MFAPNNLSDPSTNGNWLLLICNVFKKIICILNYLLLHRPKWIEWEGNKYHPCNVVWCGYQEDLPQFGKIIDIILVESKVFFCFSLYITKGIDRYHNSFIIEPTENRTVKLLSCDDERLLSFHVHALGSAISGTLHVVSKYIIFKL